MNTFRSFFCNSITVLAVAVFALTGCDKEEIVDNNDKSVFADNLIRYNVSSLQQFSSATKSESDNKKEFLDYTVSENENLPFMYLTKVESANNRNNFACGSISEQNYTKGTPIVSNYYLDRVYGNFGVYCYVYDNNRDSLYINGPKIEYNPTSKIWGEFPRYYWYIKPNNKHVFLAYSPYTDYITSTGDSLSKYLTVSYENRNMFFDYVVPDNPLDQIDLLYAKGMADSTGYVYDSKGMPYVDLNFHHALAGIKIMTALGTDDYVLEKVELCHVRNRGTFNANTQTWTLLDSLSNIISESVQVYSTDSEGKPISTSIFDGDSTMFLLPQDLDDVSLKITFSSIDTVIAGIQYKEVGTYEFDNLGESWNAGTIHTYVISLGFDQQTEWKIESNDFKDGQKYIDYTATDINFSVNSYVTVTSSSGQKEKKHVDWNMTYSTDGENFVDSCDWIDITIHPNSTTFIDDVDVSISAQDPISLPSERDEFLKSRTEKGTFTQPYDLSLTNQNNIGTRETANCYIVGAPGYYKIPLVYGNSIKGNFPNYSSYSYDNNCPFPDYNGNGIDYPWIKDDGNISSATLVWQDVPGLISNLRLLDEEVPNQELGKQGEGTPYHDNDLADDYIAFEISKDAIKQGNAVIAIMDDDNNIMWSWHIWVTDFPNSSIRGAVTDNNVKFTYNSTSYTMAPINMGWVYIGATLYPERKIDIKLEQKGNPENFQVLTITQGEHLVPNRGYGLAYQWGRKDPFPFWFATKTKRYYKSVNDAVGSIDDLSYAGGENNPMSYSWMHKNPFVFNGDMPDPDFDYFWTLNRTNPEKRTVKTVFDPCPRGYCVPNKEALDFVVIQTQDFRDKGEKTCFDGQWWGRFFCNEGGHKGDSIWLPSVGHRNSRTGMTQEEAYRSDQGEGTDGAYYSSTVVNGFFHPSVYTLTFWGWNGFEGSDGDVGSIFRSARYSGESIRMMVDE